MRKEVGGVTEERKTDDKPNSTEQVKSRTSTWRKTSEMIKQESRRSDALRGNLQARTDGKTYWQSFVLDKRRVKHSAKNKKPQQYRTLKRRRTVSRALSCSRLWPGFQVMCAPRPRLLVMSERHWLRGARRAGRGRGRWHGSKPQVSVNSGRAARRGREGRREGVR